MLSLDYCEKNRSIFGKESLISKVKNRISYVNLCTYVPMWWKKSIPASTYTHSLCSYLTARSEYALPWLLWKE